MINIKAIDALLVSSTAAASLSAPSGAGDGVDISSWNVGTATKIAFDAATVYIDADGAATLTGPVTIWGYRNGQWWALGSLDAGANMTITGDVQGLARRVDEVGIFSRLAVSASGVTGGRNYVYSFEPISVRYD